MTQDELAMRTGVSPTTILNIEQAKLEPRLGTARKIARALGVPLSEFLSEEDLPEMLSAAQFAERRNENRVKLLRDLRRGKMPRAVRTTGGLWRIPEDAEIVEEIGTQSARIAESRSALLAAKRELEEAAKIVGRALMTVESALDSLRVDPPETEGER